MTFTPLQKLLPRAAKKHHIYGAMQAILACKRAQEILDKLFKDRAHEPIRAKSIAGGILKVEVPNSSWAQEVMIHRQKIIENTNARLGKKAVKSIKTTSKTA
jgi:hypothetical protein